MFKVIEGERRRFTRIEFDCPVSVRCGEKEYQTQLLDLSFKGAMLVRPEGLVATPHAPCQLLLHLGNDLDDIVMEGNLCHQHGQRIGFCCDSIELESLHHLKRIIELNLGETSLLEREMSELAVSYSN